MLKENEHPNVDPIEIEVKNFTPVKRSFWGKAEYLIKRITNPDYRSDVILRANLEINASGEMTMGTLSELAIFPGNDQRNIYRVLLCDQRHRQIFEEIFSRKETDS